MPDTGLTNSAIINAYMARTPGSAALHRRALASLPSGIAHDSRWVKPWPLYCERGAGAWKWDVDGNRLLDLFGGHGSHLLGHCPPAVVEATIEQMRRGSQFAAGTPLEVEWAALVQELVPCAERVRFTASGTEATHMAVRLARAFTGRRKILRFHRHYHGWHDAMAFGVDGHFDGTPTPGVPEAVAEGVRLLPPNDIAAVEAALAADRDIAAVILEPLGATSGLVPFRPDVLHALRELTRAYGVLLILDEVVTGFRIAPGGAQQARGVEADLCTLAKVLAGGMPGGAVAGRAEILEALDFEASARKGREKIKHPGTYNANPVSAAAGIAMLRAVRDEDACGRANRAGEAMRAALNAVLAEEGVPWAVYGEFSFFFFFTNPQGLAIDPLRFDAFALPPEAFAPDPRKSLLQKLHLGLVVHGVDPMGHRGGILSAVHGEEEIATAAAALRATLRALRAEGEL
ncbi:MAG: aminotransferase class III-fold pyridoxal phosphate-dependent enzyme [Rhodovarius sp.]|nr:aminotransferase class III-fold pyridoxal phosphate-dependent enzyme [Rhodovarius sp.]MCX7931163.1 aminotransferase class III-fold pyridoxal phosphate-dependent enzyme [Rhodovarius sp.]MDW8313442.1 aminotransferase class III-fold pyridoxal phosphate-dependent enzyme [Rhodovarius sp.]